MGESGEGLTPCQTTAFLLMKRITSFHLQFWGFSIVAVGGWGEGG